MVAITELTNWAIDLIDVRKTYGRTVHALRGVNIQVGRGEIFGLLGLNGAGKTTLVKIMMTVVRPTKALGTILGRPLGHRGKLARIGYLPEDHRFPGYLTGARVLDHYAALAKVPKARRQANAARLLQRLGIAAWADTRIDQYSKGMLQRLGIVQALMNDPDLVVLDEPTEGLDPIGRRSVRELLLELRQEGKTIFLNSHLLSEVEKVCDRVAILVEGLVARQGTMEELTEATVDFHITFAGDARPLREKIEAMGGHWDGAAVIVPGHDTRKINDVIDLLRGGGLLIEGVQAHRFSLEDILVQVSAESAVPSPTQPPARLMRT